MDADVVYSFLINSSWFFLGGWTLLVLLAAAEAFREELSDTGSTDR